MAKATPRLDAAGMVVIETSTPTTPPDFARPRAMIPTAPAAEATTSARARHDCHARPKARFTMAAARAAVMCLFRGRAIAIEPMSRPPDALRSRMDLIEVAPGES